MRGVPLKTTLWHRGQQLAHPVPWPVVCVALLVTCPATLNACNSLFGLDDLDYGAGAPPGAMGGAGGSSSGGTTASGGTAGATTSSTGGSGGAAGGSPTHDWERRITVTGEVDTPARYSVAVTFNHAALVAAQKSSLDGNDVRILRDDQALPVQIARVLDPWSSWNSATTTLWFATADLLTAGDWDDRYLLVYGGQPTDKAAEDANAVYQLFDDFEDGEIDPVWTLSEIGNASGTLTESAGALRLSGTSGDLWTRGDDILFVHATVSGNIVADSLVRAADDFASIWGKLGGVSVRQSLLPDSPHAAVVPISQAAARQMVWRLESGALSASNSPAGQNAIPETERIIRIGNTLVGASSADGESWQIVGNCTLTDALVDPLYVGIPLANATDNWIEVEWFRVRSLVSPEPQLTLHPETPASAPP